MLKNSCVVKELSIFSECPFSSERLRSRLARRCPRDKVRRLAPEGMDAWAEVIERGYEGLVAKDEVSAYESGRTTRWLKVKQKGWTVEEDRWRRTISVASSREPKGK